jgi:hypothetical protein
MLLFTHYIKSYFRKSIFLIGLFFFLLKLTNAQENAFTISGQIIDSISQKTIKNVHIGSPGSNIGVISNTNGFFEMRVRSHPIVLEFSFIGYEAKKVTVSSENDTNFIVYLIPKTYELSEVNVNENSDTYNANIYKYSVLDYEFMGDSILLLQKRRSAGGRASLVLLNWNFDTLLYKRNLPKGISKIFKDCLNSYHLISNDSAYQIAIMGDSLALYQPFEINWFQQIMGGCIFKKEQNLFFEFPIYQGFGHEIVYINEETKKKNLFVRYVDKKQFERMVNDMSEISSYYYLHDAVNAATNDSATVKHIHYYDYHSRFLKEINDLPIKNAICLNKDTIHYFNFYESKIQSFSQLDQPPVEVEIDYKAQLGWSADLFTDAIDHKIYSLIKNKSDFIVYALNIKEGTTEYKTRISVFEGQNLKINNGYLYYLKNPSANSYQVKKLSRKKINPSSLSHFQGERL